jgi:hypothetical protein
MWLILSATFWRIVVISGFLHQQNWPPWYNWNSIMVIYNYLLASSVVDGGFDYRSGQIKNYAICICCFSAKKSSKIPKIHKMIIYAYTEYNKYTNKWPNFSSVDIVCRANMQLYFILSCICHLYQMNHWRCC